MNCSLDILLPLYDASNSPLLGAIESMKNQNPFTDICPGSQNTIFVIGSSENLTYGSDKDDE